MKNLYIILSLTLTFLLLSGCNSDKAASPAEMDEDKATEAGEEGIAENEEEIENVNAVEEVKEDLVSKIAEYETIVLEDSQEKHEITIEYPKFGFDPLDEIIADRLEKDFKGQQEQAESYQQDGSTEHYSYNITFDEPIITENIVSIYFEGRFYHGGGFPFTFTINYDLENERLITLDDVLNEHSTSLEIMADLLGQKLIYDERFAQYREDPITDKYKAAVKEETTPDERYYDSFTLTDDSITFYKQYYSIIPNAEGIIGIEITWDEVEIYMNSEDNNDHNAGPVMYKFGDPVEPTSTLQYIDEEYGFSLTVPESWRDSYLVHEITVTESHSAPVEPSKVITFSMVEDGKYIGAVFFIEVLEGVSEEKARAFYENGDFGGFVAAGNGVALAHKWIGQMAEPLYEEPYIETGNQFGKRVMDDRPIVLETVEFH